MPSEDVNLNPGRKPGPPGIRAENWRLTEEKAPKRAEEDAALVAARIRELVESAAPTVCEPGPDDEDKWRPAKFGDIALLLRNRTHLSNFIEAFRRAGIPYAVTAGNALMDSRAVQDLIQALHLVNTPADSFHAAAFLRSSLTGISDDTLYLLASRCEGNLGKAFLELRPDDDTLVGEGMAAADASILVKARRLLDRWLLLRGRTSPAELCRQIVLDTSFPEYLLLDSRGEQELANVDAFLDLLETAPQLSLPSCLHQLAEGLLGGEESEADIDAGGANVVQIMTIHAAKGLQFPIVILADNAQSLKKGSVSAFLYERDPDGGYKAGLALGTGAGRAEIADYRELSDAEAKASRDEEQRLLYVALTRAKDRLIITTPPPETQKIDQEWVETLALLTPPQFRKTRVVEAVAPSLPIFLDYPENAEPWQAQAVSPGRSAVSPSAIQSYNDCPRAYYLQYRLRLSIRQDAMENERFTDAPDGPAGSSVVNRDRALALGTAVHAAIEGIILGKDTAAVLAERTAERVVDSAEVRTLTEAFVRVFKPAGSVSAEKDFAVPLAPGLDLRGQIDYLEHLPGGGYRIWDYKTNRVEDQDLEALVEHYAVQVRLYAWAVAQETGEPVKQAALLFLRRNQLVPIPVEDRTVAANTAAAVASALKMRDGRAPVDFPRNRDHCPKCPLRAFCG
jgi:ATP-dependent helicase/nuclease subunit A